VRITVTDLGTGTRVRSYETVRECVCKREEPSELRRRVAEREEKSMWVRWVGHASNFFWGRGACTLRLKGKRKERREFE